jgi:hypothetical protein
MIFDCSSFWKTKEVKRAVVASLVVQALNTHIQISYTHNLITQLGYYLFRV